MENIHTDVWVLRVKPWCYMCSNQSFSEDEMMLIEYGYVVSFSGNVVIETKFFDGDLLVSTSRVRVYYV